MNEQLVSDDTAKLAKEKNFDWDTIFGLDSLNIIRGKLASNHEGSFISWDRYDRDLRLPSQSLLQRWIREIHNIHLLIEPYYNEEKVLLYGFDLILEKTKEETFAEEGFKNYEQALEVGLQEALKLIK